MKTEETKEAIIFLENTLYMCIRGEDDVPGYKTKYNYWIRKVIDLLQRGKKYEAMWKELLHQVNQIHPLHLNGEDIRRIINNARQKYFPEPVKDRDYFYEATSKDPHLRKVKFKEEDE